MYTDALNFHGFDEYLRKRLSADNRESVAQTFVYLFNHKGPASEVEYFASEREDLYGKKFLFNVCLQQMIYNVKKFIVGVAHADELQFVFPINKYNFPTAVPTANDLRMRNIFVRMLVNFVQTG